MIRPRLRLIGLAAATLGVVVTSEIMPGLGEVTSLLSIALLVACVLASAVDIYLARRVMPEGLQHHVPGPMAVGRSHDIEVVLENPHAFCLRLEYNHMTNPRDASTLAVQGLPRVLKIPPGHGARFSYQVRPLSRGTLALGAYELSVSGPLGLWDIRRRVLAPQRLQAGPDFDNLEQLARQAWGHGPVNSAASPLQRASLAPALLPCPELLLWLDTSPAMYSASALAHATDAALALAFMAVARAMPVALHLNTGPGPRQLAASASERQLPEMHRLLEGLEPSAQPIDFNAEVGWLLGRRANPAWIILITRLPADSARLAGPLNELRRHDRLTIVDITDDAPATQPVVRNDAQAWAYCKAMQAIGAHEQARWELEQVGFEVVQTPPGELVQALTTYFAVANR